MGTAALGSWQGEDIAEVDIVVEGRLRQIAERGCTQELQRAPLHDYPSFPLLSFCQYFPQFVA